jgi:hypothetical protein
MKISISEIGLRKKPKKDETHEKVKEFMFHENWLIFIYFYTLFESKVKFDSELTNIDLNTYNLHEKNEKTP